MTRHPGQWALGFSGVRTAAGARAGVRPAIGERPPGREKHRDGTGSRAETGLLQGPLPWETNQVTEEAVRSTDSSPKPKVQFKQASNEQNQQEHRVEYLNPHNCQQGEVAHLQTSPYKNNLFECLGTLET